MSDAATLFREAQALKPTDRLRLVEMLIADLDHPDQNIDQLWGAEAQRRLDLFRRGELKTLSHDEVMAKYQRR